MVGDPIDGYGAATEQWVAQWTASVSERAERARQLATRVATLTSTASGAGGAVQVTVAASGALTDLRLDDRVLRWQPDEIADRIMTVMRRAQGQLSGEVARAAAETVGAESETARAVVASYEQRFPTQPDDEPDPAGPQPANWSVPTRRDATAGREPGRTDPTGQR